MLSRYIGGKSAILDPLVGLISQHAEPGAHVVDAFSGSLAVSMALKQKGFRVTGNDINLFSATFADAYLTPSTPPRPELSSLVNRGSIPSLRRTAALQVDSLAGEPGWDFLQNAEWRSNYAEYVAILNYLQNMTPKDLSPKDRHSHFFDTYCEEGANSDFISSRGRTGRRRYFTPANAERIDLILSQIRKWSREGSIDPHTRALLLSGLVRATERIANTQGTFHDFIRKGWDSRALNPLRLAPPPLDPLVAGIQGHRHGRERDTLDFIGDVDAHAVLYLDPPYNFRQYSAYYFLPNVICRFADMPDPDEYFQKVRYVRGQNPEDDFTSTFCKASRFISDLETLIAKARCTTVVISYYNGANHWGSFDSEPTNAGRQKLSELLSGDIFEPGSQHVAEVSRRNYASYGGYTARQVTELLFVATKRHTVTHAAQPGLEGRLQPVA